MFHWVLHIK